MARSYDAWVRITSAPNPQLSPLPRKNLPSVEEVGGDKTVSQHIGNAGFGLSSVAAFSDSMGTLLDTVVQFPGVEAVPGLNLGVAAVESYNSIHNLKQHHPIVAATSAGNAAGSLGTFLAQVSMGSALIGSQSAMLLGAGSVLGAVGGGLGIAAGVAEIRKGREIQQATGSSRTLMMGYLDIASGVTSLSGAAAMAAGAAPLGVSLMMLANLVDLTGIGVDYLWKKSENPSQKPAEDGAKAS